MNKHLQRSGKILLVLVFFSTMQIDAQSFASVRSGPSLNTKPEMQKAQPLNDVLKQIGERFDIKFAYNLDAVDGKVVEMELEGDNADELLRKVLKPYDLLFDKIDAKHYVVYATSDSKKNVKKLKRKGTLDLGHRSDTDVSASGETSMAGSSITQPLVFEQAADLTVSGKVTDENGSILPGATVLEKGTTNGTTTDVEGNYTLTVSDENAVLSVSFLGYLTQEIPLANRTQVDVSLLPDVATLTEVVVVGYGVQKKVNVTGSVASISGDKLKKAPVASLSNALVGNLPGIITTQRSGEPGQDDANIFIRGIGTPGDAGPLFVIDGIPRSQSDFTQLDPNEIESVNVLKDAGAAVFGSRAGNGVILVTTRRGASGKARFSYSYNLGFQSPARLPEYVGAADYLRLQNEASVNAGGAILFDDDRIQSHINGDDPFNFPDTDWYDITLNDHGTMNQHNMNVSGGTENISYFVSAGYLDQDGLYDNNNFKRYNIRSNIDAQVTRTTKLSMDLSGRLENTEQPDITTDNLFFGLLRNIPIVSPYNEDGTFRLTSPYQNTVAGITDENGYNRSSQTVFLGKLSLEQELPIKGLKVKGVVAYDRSYTSRKNWSTGVIEFTPQGQPTPFRPPTLRESFNQSQRFTPELHLNYANSFGNSSVSGLLIYSQAKTMNNQFSGFAQNFVAEAIDNAFFNTDIATQTYTGEAENFARRGLVGRFTYDLSSKYLFEFSFRYDGSENFPSGERFGLFPAVAAGWVVSSEDFMKGVPWLDFLKLRASYGVVGNDNLVINNQTSRFLYFASFTAVDGILGDYSFLNDGVSELVPALTPSAIANPNVTWESVAKFNVGLESDFFNGLLSLDVDFFYDVRTDILARRDLAVPQTFGAILPAENLGEVHNRGIEMILTHKRKIGDFQYNIGGNVTYARNKVINLEEAESVPDRLSRENRSLNQFFGYEAIGIFQNQEEIDNAPDQTALGGTTGPDGSSGVFPGDIRYKDLNNDNIINDEDRGPIGRSNIPELVYGITGGVSYKGLDLSFLFQGASRVDQYLTQQAIGAFFNGGNAAEEWLDRWTPENTGGGMPRILVNPGQNADQQSSFWLQDASYLRLRNVELGYSLPSKPGSENFGECHACLYLGSKPFDFY